MQGFNMGRYVPPDLEGTLSANQVTGKHALGNRARKAGQGILTVRFEMPFAVWCNHCPKPTIIGQGVRFNAEKKKVGNYFSTPIWAFRMKHVACGGWIEIRTDPKNTEYLVAEGGKRRDTGEDKVREGDLEIRTDEEKRRLQEDAFAALEVKIDDRKQADADKARIEELYVDRERDWDDPYAVNKRLRKTFRTERKDLERKAAATEDLKSRMSLGIELLEESQEDRQRAAIASFGNPDRETASGQALFKRSVASNSKNRRKVKEIAKQNLQQEVVRSTRSTMDMFGPSRKNGEALSLAGVKRKHNEGPKVNEATSREKSSATTLVEYDSD